MIVHDLGALEAPVMVFGGPYSNLPALAALCARAEALSIPAGRMICTGDVVAYCASPAETVARIRALGCAVVAGNCERQLAANAVDCGCGFEAGTTCDLLSAGWYAHANANVGPEDRAWMAGVPDVVVFEQAGKRFAVIHGGLSDISRFIWPTSAAHVFAEEVALIERAVGKVDGVLAGHCGVAFQRHVRCVNWINAGVIGMPPHDGDPRTRYVVLRDGHAEICKLHYDHDQAQRDMCVAGLVQGYDRALVTGYWPSEDVLPPELRAEALRDSGW